MADIKTYNEYTLTELTKNSVNILIQTFADINGLITKVGAKQRISCANSELGRQKLPELIPEQYALAVLAVWGDTPTVPDPELPQEE